MASFSLKEKGDETATTFDRAVLTPLREGAGVIAGVKAVLAIFKSTMGRTTSNPRSEEEDPLFIG
jgi:hypothetical protein